MLHNYFEFSKIKLRYSHKGELKMVESGYENGMELFRISKHESKIR